ncbi:AAA family ATPase [Iamia sp.]|uniref:AAA family ATPase n=1 Tax=Iamia sp. TaxID=2722710 RepID=UPI002C67891A|nr:AAA family ATPase [Iamia sp.]HXH56507.1 AAA family ATPase [Iamia sp.]
MPPPFVTRVRVQSYKSIKACDVELGALSILVGPNGSGKSNFLDALRFTADALSTTLDGALRERGGINEVRRRSGGHPHNFGVRLDLRLPDGVTGHYAFKVGSVKGGGFRVTDEECVVHTIEFGRGEASFRVQGGDVETTVEERLPAVAEDRLYLVSASNVAPFRSVFDALTSMGFYNLSPAAIRPLQQPDAGTLLRRDGSNLASVLGHLGQRSPATLDRVVEYLRRVAPGVEGVAMRSVGPMETIEFRQQVAGQRDPWAFAASNMSDGTLRGLGVLVALLQSNGRPPTLIGIEEPEVALHPAAVGVLLDAIGDASQHTQVLITSHSPELLDRDDLDGSSLLSVVADQGVTVIGQVSRVGRDVLRDRLFTAGELLRLDQLEPDDDARRASQVDADQLKLFGP